MSIVKNIKFTFGYFGPSIYNRLTWRLCNKFPIIPSIEMSLFKTYNNSNKPSHVRHYIGIGFCKTLFEIKKVNNKWKFETIQ